MSLLRPVWLLLGLAAVAALFRHTEAASAFPPEVKTYTEKEAKKFLKNLNQEWAKKVTIFYHAEWDYETNMTVLTLEKKQKAAVEVAKFQKQQNREVLRYPRQNFEDKDVARQLKLYSTIGVPSLPEEKYIQFQKALAEIRSIPRCHNVSCNLKDGLSPGEELKARMDCWLHERSGYNASMTWKTIAEFAADAGHSENFAEFSDYLMRHYEGQEDPEEFRTQMNNLHPLYKELFAFCRYRLRQKYGNALVPNSEVVVEYLADDCICKTDPIPRKPLDFPGALRAKAFTVRRLFGLPDEFFRSLNMSGLPDSVWEKSILEARPNVSMNCIPFTQDFLDNKDYRMRSCSKVAEETLFVASKLVSEIVYRMEMRHQPSIYRQNTPDVLIEAVGVLVALSLVSPNFLRYQGLLAGDDSVEMDVNLLYMIARNTLKPAVKSFSKDEWRVESLRRSAPSHSYNCLWWKLRSKWEGIDMAFNRSSRDFDPGAEYKVLYDPFSTPFKGTTGFLLAFAMHRNLCQRAGLFDPEDPARLPLHRCNLLGQPLVSEVLSKMMKTGGSRPWKEVVSEAIGEFSLSAEPMFQYFQPLQKFLTDSNARTGEHVGWSRGTHLECKAPRWFLEEVDPERWRSGVYTCPQGEPAEPSDAPFIQDEKDGSAPVPPKLRTSTTSTPLDVTAASSENSSSASSASSAAPAASQSPSSDTSTAGMAG